MDRYYTASKSRSQGRESWAVIFRHPVRTEPTTGKPGRRVRRGLGTGDPAEADRLVAELNELLSTPTYWESAAREIARGRFDERVVTIFYDGIEPGETDFEAVREAVVPLPGAADGYRRILLLGTTGAGKTTLVRQLLGTDPATERFPSTSTAKTTVADTELIFADGMYRVVVTFVGRDEVIDYLTENASEAALAVYRDKSDGDVQRRLLDHVNQRFRFSYVLGRRDLVADLDDLDDDTDDDEVPSSGAELVDVGDLGEIDLDATGEVVAAAVQTLREIVAKHEGRVRAELNPEEHDERVIEEIIEENLDRELRTDESFHEIVDSLIDEIEKRFELLGDGEFRRNRQGWPVSWAWETDDRDAFLRSVMRFSSNYAPLFGRLLTPLVNGMRVAGPFRPAWETGSIPQLVLIDGEGLGHTPNSAAALSTPVAKRVETVDLVLLVDSAAQPMQAAPVAAIRSIITSGNGGKLVFAFTHFDLVRGDNLRGFSAREQHVLASAENVLKALGDEVGPFGERVLRQRLERARFFVGGIQDELDDAKKSDSRSISQLRELLLLVLGGSERHDVGVIRPVYDRVNLVLAVTEASRNFHETWQGLLGLTVNPGAPKEHWTRVKALSRRLAEGWKDEYDTLKPVAHLQVELQKQIYRMLQQPLRWEGGNPTDDDKQQLIDDFSNAVANRLFELTARRVWREQAAGWRDAYAQSGSGSTFVRARIIAADVYDRGVPIPSVTPSPDQNSFLHEVTELVGEVADELGITLR